MSVQVSYKKQTLFYLLLIILTLGILEIIANIWWIEEIKCSFVDNELFLDKGEEYLKQLCDDQNNLTMNEFIILPDQNLNTININSLGFRGSEFESEKPENVYRIFLIGGSTTFGGGSSSDETTISGYLQKLFNDDVYIYEIEVINAGKSGFNTFTEKKFIFETIQFLEPDLILMYDGWNDIRADYKSEFTKNNWTQICDLGEKNKFDTMIFIQPVLAFSNKKMTQQEYSHYLIDSDYFGMKLTTKTELYNSYVEESANLSNCTKAFDFRNILDDYTIPIYFDGGHMGDSGNEIVANSIYNSTKEFVKNAHPNKNKIINKNINDTDSSIFFYEPLPQEEKSFNYGKIFLEFKGFLSFYKTPIFIEEIVNNFFDPRLRTGT